MSSTQAADAQWFGQPRGLSTLFFTELWERLSYYGMRAILILFMVDALETGGFGMTEGKAAAIYGLYTAGVYLLALPGGWVADRLIGQQRAVFWGGVVIAAGHFTMALPVLPVSDALEKGSFYLGLVLIVIGTGLLKPNVSAVVGDLYPEKGARRDAGFSIFYMGINIGAFLGPLICGYLGETIDWHLGFSAAGFGMVIGLIQFHYGKKYLGTYGTLSDDTAAVQARRGDWTKLWAGVGATLGVTILLFVLASPLGLTLQKVAGAMGVVIVSLAVVYFLFVIFAGGLTRREQKRVVVIFFLFCGAALFWSGFEQAGSSMNLFAEQETDRMILGWEMPASFLQAVNPLFIIIFAPVFGWLWLALASREPSIPMKFGLGLVLLGAGFLVLAWGSTFLDQNGDGVSPMWLVVTYFLHTAGELCLSPVGLSSVTKLSPHRYVGQMMGTWFMGAALGNLIAGLVAGRIESMPLPQLFSTVATIVIVGGGLFILFTIPIKWLIGDLSQDDDAAAA
ncbi:MAG: peptide MFS transporter [Acidobacteriota bacterium]